MNSSSRFDPISTGLHHTVNPPITQRARATPSITSKSNFTAGSNINQYYSYDHIKLEVNTKVYQVGTDQNTNPTLKEFTVIELKNNDQVIIQNTEGRKFTVRSTDVHTDGTALLIYYLTSIRYKKDVEMPKHEEALIAEIKQRDPSFDPSGIQLGQGLSENTEI